jgi:predicted TIM-barrel fold metal-dependent hydrolase
MIDAAVHNDVPSTQALFPYLPPYWIEHVQNTMFKGPTEFYYPPTSPIAARPGSRPTPPPDYKPPEGRPAASLPGVIPAASDLATVRRHVLDRVSDPAAPASPAQANGTPAHAAAAHAAAARATPAHATPANATQAHATQAHAAAAHVAPAGAVQANPAQANVEMAILCSAYPVDSLHNPDAAIAFARAFNDWQIAEWLDKEPRLRASIVVPIQLPTQAAAEIDRIGDHPGFVQVALPVRTERPLGHRVYHPVWDAIARHGLVAAIQFGGVPGNPPTPSGWPSYFYEEYVGAAFNFASQLTNIVAEGVFDQFPSVRVSLVESGFTWLPAHMWRFDKEWRNLRRLVPWVRRAPSEYIREHVRLTVQPLDARTGDPRQLLDVVDQLGSDDMLLYASHYPRVHAGDPETTLIEHLPAALAHKIRDGNARALYRL